MKFRMRLPLNRWAEYDEITHIFADAANEIRTSTGIVFTSSSDLWTLFYRRFEYRVVRDMFYFNEDNINKEKISFMRNLINVKTSALMPLINTYASQIHELSENPDSWLSNWKMNGNSVNSSTTNFGGSDTVHHGKSNTQSGSISVTHETSTNSNTDFRNEYRDTTSPTSFANSEGGTTVTDYDTDRVTSGSTTTQASGLKNITKSQALQELLETQYNNFYEFYFSEIAKLILLDTYEL